PRGVLEPAVRARRPSCPSGPVAGIAHSLLLSPRSQDPPRRRRAVPTADRAATMPRRRRDVDPTADSAHHDRAHHRGTHRAPPTPVPLAGPEVAPRGLPLRRRDPHRCSHAACRLALVTDRSAGGPGDSTIRRVLVCPQEFKGTLSAARATELIAAAVRSASPGIEVIEQPMADGGPGTAEIVGRARSGAPRTVTV